MLFPIALFVASLAQSAVAQSSVAQSSVAQSAAAALPSNASAITCYSHDGVSAADSPISANTTAKVLVGCNPEQPYTTCCKDDESCAPDLLCHRSDGSVARQYCTDPTWTTDQCSPLCPDFDEAGTVLTTCPDGSYCCGRDNEECCRRNAGYQINPRNGQILIQNATSTRSSSRTSTTSTSSSTSTPAAAGASQTGSSVPSALPTPLPPPSTGLSTGAKAGIAIGAIVGVAIIAGLAFLLFRERKKRRALVANEKQTSMGYRYGNNNMAVGRHEMQQPPSELGAYERNNEQKYQFRGELGDGQGKPSELHS